MATTSTGAAPATTAHSAPAIVLTLRSPICTREQEVLAEKRLGFNWNDSVRVDASDLKDKVLVAIIKTLLVTGNRPLRPRELQAALRHLEYVILGGDTPFATISSRISQHFTRAQRARRTPLLCKVQIEPERNVRTVGYQISVGDGQYGISVEPVVHIPQFDSETPYCNRVCADRKTKRKLTEVVQPEKKRKGMQIRRFSSLRRRMYEDERRMHMGGKKKRLAGIRPGFESVEEAGSDLYSTNDVYKYEEDVREEEPPPLEFAPQDRCSSPASTVINDLPPTPAMTATPSIIDRDCPGEKLQSLFVLEEDMFVGDWGTALEELNPLSEGEMDKLLDEYYGK